MKLITSFFILLITIKLFSLSFADELKSKYTTIIYENEDLLRKFNNELYIGRLSYLLKGKNNLTVFDEVKNKVDLIVEKVEMVLEMFPNEINFKIIIYPSSKDVQNIFKERYRKKVKYLAFYTPRDKTIFISAKKASLRILAHEIGHAVVDHFFDVSPSAKIHEVLAQYCEKHITD